MTKSTAMFCRSSCSRSKLLIVVEVEDDQLAHNGAERDADDDRQTEKEVSQSLHL